MNTFPNQRIVDAPTEDKGIEPSGITLAQFSRLLTHPGRYPPNIQLSSVDGT